MRTFADFEEKIGDVILSLLKEIKYVVPNPLDKNSTRWPLADFWLKAQKTAKSALAEYISNGKRNEIIKKYRAELKEIYQKQIEGMIPAYAVIQGQDDAAHLPGVLEGLLSDFSAETKKNQKKFRNKIKKSKNKFQFLDDK